MDGPVRERALSPFTIILIGPGSLGSLCLDVALMADLLSYFFWFVHLLKFVNQIARSLFFTAFEHF